MSRSEMASEVLERRAVVYVRQSTGIQVQENLESKRRQYELVDRARSFGFKDVVVIDDDLGKSASGRVDRPGFESLIAQLCQGIVGAIFCLESSRLARNGREWHHLLELCGLVGTRVIDVEGIYDPSHADDRLVLGMKGTMSEFELSIMRRRLLEGARSKALRGELRIPVPVGYVWPPETGPVMDPDRRVQDAVRMFFRLFDKLGSARQVMLKTSKDDLRFPRATNRWHPSTLRWLTPSYRNVISVLTNPFYGGAYAYGKTTNKTTLVDGKLRKSYKHARPRSSWTVLIHDHHESYVSWEQFERNQEIFRRNNYSKQAGDPKSGRGGRALLSGLLRCRRCGRALQAMYQGGPGGYARYHCRQGADMLGLAPCIFFSARRPDELVAQQSWTWCNPWRYKRR